MDPNYWQLDQPTEPPPDYEPPDGEPLAIEPPAIEADDYGNQLDKKGEANKILDHLELPNYDDVQMRLDKPEMTATKQRNYLDKVVKDADRRRRQVIAMKSASAKKFNKGLIDAPERYRIHRNSDKFRLELNYYIKSYKFKSKSIKGYGTKRQQGRGVYFFNDAKELLEKSALIIGEMEAGNTSIEMRNTGQSILDALLRSKSINRG